jgi:succinate dehydrogenase / fumarate reductase flavoprotein subunit
MLSVGTGLAGSASATLAELGYNVKSFVFKIHRVARTLLRHKVELTQQKTTKVTEIPFSDCFTVKEEIIVHVNQIVSLKFLLTSLISAFQGVPLAREYGGLLDNRSLRYACF